MYIMDEFITKQSHYGDIAAIPFFALLIYYFYLIENKTPFEYLLFLFSIAGFVLDILYTYIFLFRINPTMK